MDNSLKMQENQWLCTKCYDHESCLYAASIREKFERCLERLKLGDFSCESDGGNIIDSLNLMEEKPEYCLHKLNEIFKLFQMDPLIL